MMRPATSAHEPIGGEPGQDREGLVDHDPVGHAPRAAPKGPGREDRTGPPTPIA